jgi:eukaryotic-like serine/threonine-protein kinase
MELEVGQSVGDYEILSILGSGGMGRVYQVRNRLSDRIEAMKVLLPRLTVEPEVASRFIAEIRTLASFTHPNIAQLRTAFQVKNQLVMIMEFVDGFPVEFRTKRGRIPQDEALHYVLQLLSALSYAHARGVIHRDIKPANLMVTQGGVVKLMDFGISKSEVRAQLTRPGIALGSVHYMSPEQMRGDAVDARSDLYSVGILLYEMLTGCRPFEAGGVDGIAHQQLSMTPKPPIEVNPNLSRALNELVLIALAKEPAKRFQSANAFAKALRAQIPRQPGIDAAPRPHFARRSAAGPGTTPRHNSAAAAPLITVTSACTRNPPPAVLAMQSIQPSSPSFVRRIGWMALGAFGAILLTAVAAGIPHLLNTDTAPSWNPLSTSLSKPSTTLHSPSPASSGTATTTGTAASTSEMARDSQELLQLQSRAHALRARMGEMQDDEDIDGTGAAHDLEARYARMHSHLRAAAKDLNNRDMVSTRRELDKAQKEISPLESTFNQ